MREFFPTAPATIGRIFYVSQQGSDSGDGSAGRPFRTISRGARELRAADTLIVGGGLYRETVPLSGLKQNITVTVSLFFPTLRLSCMITRPPAGRMTSSSAPNVRSTTSFDQPA